MIDERSADMHNAGILIRELTAERDKLAFDLHHQKEVYAVCKADNERLRRAAVPGNGPEMLRMQVENDRLRAEVANMRTTHLASQQVIVDAFAVQHLVELREAAARVRSAHFTAHPCGCEACAQLDAVLAKVAP